MVAILCLNIWSLPGCGPKSLTLGSPAGWIACFSAVRIVAADPRVSLWKSVRRSNRGVHQRRSSAPIPTPSCRPGHGPPFERYRTVLRFCVLVTRICKPSAPSIAQPQLAHQDIKALPWRCQRSQTKRCHCGYQSMSIHEDQAQNQQQELLSSHAAHIYRQQTRIRSRYDSSNPILRTGRHIVVRESISTPVDLNFVDDSAVDVVRPASII